jgi:hypothetical protein
MQIHFPGIANRVDWASLMTKNVRAMRLLCGGAVYRDNRKSALALKHQTHEEIEFLCYKTVGASQQTYRNL